MLVIIFLVVSFLCLPVQLKDNRKAILCPSYVLFRQKSNYIIVLVSEGNLDCSCLFSQTRPFHPPLSGNPRYSSWGSVPTQLRHQGSDPHLTAVGIWDQIPPQ